MDEPLEPKFLTSEHYRAFGRIVQAFVSVETLYAHIILRVFKIPDDAGAFVMSAYGYDNLKNFIKTMVSEWGASEEDKKACGDLIDGLKTKYKLRNYVAHTPWKPGHRAGSIKPMVIKTRGTLVILGTEHNEKDWTAEELHAEATDILQRGIAVAAFFQDRGVDLGNPEQAED